MTVHKQRTKLSSGFTHYLLIKPSQITTAKIKLLHVGSKKKVVISSREKVLPPFKEEMLDASLSGACESKSFKKFYIFTLNMTRNYHSYSFQLQN